MLLGAGLALSPDGRLVVVPVVELTGSDLWLYDVASGEPARLTFHGNSDASAPAWAPLPTMMIIRNAGMPARAAVAIAIGPSNAAVDTFPGPTEARPQPNTKKMTGMRPTLPRQTRTA